MKKDKINIWLITALALLIITAILTMIFGEGMLNLGMIGVKIKRTAPITKVAQVAQVTAPATCPDGSFKEDVYCVYTLDLGNADYFVIKKGDNFIIYDSSTNKMKGIFEQNGISINEGNANPAFIYTLLPLDKRPANFTQNISLIVGYYNAGEGSVPAFTLSAAAAESVQGSRSLVVDLQQKNIKIRFNNIRLPLKEIIGING